MTTEAPDRRNAAGSLPGKIIEWNLLLVINNSADVWLNADKNDTRKSNGWNPR